MNKVRRISAVFLALLLAMLCAVAAAEAPQQFLAAGGSFMYAQNSDGVLYCFGDNQYGQLGRGNSKTYVRKVFVFSSKNPDLDPAEIRDIICGCDYSYFLMNDGRIFGVGTGSQGQLMDDRGHSTHVLLPLEDRTVQTIATGYRHTLALNAAGEVYGWGRNHLGQLGRGNDKTLGRIPVKLDLPKITAIACGGFHSAAIDEDGNLWMWGDNSYHQISPGKEKKFTSPVKIDLGGMKVKMVQLGGHFSSFVDENGDMYMWGRNDTCQVSINSGKEKIVTERVKVNLPLPVKTYYCYGCQTWCILEDGSLWTWGKDGNGELAIGFRTPQNSGLPLSQGELEYNGSKHKGPFCSKILDSGAVAVTVGDMFGAVLMEDGRILTAGMNKFGQLGRIAPYTGDPFLGEVEWNNQ